MPAFWHCCPKSKNLGARRTMPQLPNSDWIAIQWLAQPPTKRCCAERPRHAWLGVADLLRTTGQASRFGLTQAEKRLERRTGSEKHFTCAILVVFGQRGKTATRHRCCSSATRLVEAHR